MVLVGMRQASQANVLETLSSLQISFPVLKRSGLVLIPSETPSYRQ